MANQYQNPISSEGGLWIVLLDTILLVPVIMAGMFFLPVPLSIALSLIIAGAMYAVLRGLK